MGFNVSAEMVTCERARSIMGTGAYGATGRRGFASFAMRDIVCQIFTVYVWCFTNISYVYLSNVNLIMVRSTSNTKWYSIHEIKCALVEFVVN